MKFKQVMLVSCVFLAMIFLLLSSQCSKKQQEPAKPNAQGLNKNQDAGQAQTQPQNVPGTPPPANPNRPPRQIDQKSIEDQKQNMDNEIAKIKEELKGKTPGTDEYLDLDQKAKELEFKKVMLDYQVQMQNADPEAREKILAQVQPVRVSFHIGMLINDLRNPDQNRKELAHKRLVELIGQDAGASYKDWTQWWDKNKEDFINSGKWKETMQRPAPGQR